MTEQGYRHLLVVARPLKATQRLSQRGALMKPPCYLGNGLMAHSAIAVGAVVASVTKQSQHVFA
jgi:hypothetical protein